MKRINYIDKGRSILRFFLRANLTLLVIFISKSNSSITNRKITARLKCLKYNDTAEKTRNARMTSSHITKIATSTLEEARLVVEEKKETEAQSCLDRIWYSRSCSAKFDRVIILPNPTRRRARSPSPLTPPPPLDIHRIYQIRFY